MISGVVLRGIFDHFSPRRIEWFFAVGVTALGGKLALPANTFSSVPNVYDAMAAIATEENWAKALIVIGGFRLLALFFNGSYPPFAPYSPAVRTITSFFCSGVWALLFYGFLVGNSAGLFVVLLATAFLFEASVCIEIGREAGAALGMAHGSPRRLP